MSAASTNGKPEAKPYISRLSISGFKSIRHVELELGRLNVLIGANGSGKSNLASAIRMLESLTRGELQLFVAKSGGTSSLFRRAEVRAEEIGLEIECAHARGKWKFIQAYGDSLAIALEQFVAANSHWNTLVPNAESALFDHRAPPPPTFRPLFETIRGVLGSIRSLHVNDTGPEARIRQTGDIDDNVQLHSDGRNLAAFLYKLQQVRPEHFRVLTGTIKLVAPFFESFALRPNELNPQTILLRWKEAGSGEEFGCHLLSDGTLRFIALAALLSQPKESLPSLIFLDEPEMGLHPAALTHLVGLIKTAALHSQVIVATQSVEMLNHFEAEDVIVVERHEGATEFNRLDSGALTEWLEDYSLGELWLKNIIGGRITR